MVRNVSFKTNMQLFSKILNAPLQWFDITPIGKIINSLVSDQESIDNSLYLRLSHLMQSLITIISYSILVCTIIPWFMPFILLYIFAYYRIQKYTNAYAQSSKDFISAAQGPIVSSFTEACDGMASIRAFKYTSNCKEKLIDELDHYAKATFSYFQTKRWMKSRIILLGSVLLALALSFILFDFKYHIININVGMLGIVIMSVLDGLSYLATLVGSKIECDQILHGFVKIVDFTLHIPSEKRDGSVFPSWPSKGKIELQNLSLRYRPELNKSISNISCIVQPCERVAIVGRTGSGKSTLSLGLVRLIEACPTQSEASRILVDGINIGDVSLTQLRQGITLVPQEAILYSGSLKSNIDPLNKTTDLHIFEVMSMIGLWDLLLKKFNQVSDVSQKGKSEVRITIHKSINPQEKMLIRMAKSLKKKRNLLNMILQLKVAENGNNFSSGERQLICFARALIKHSKIYIFDESTANMNGAMDDKIHEVISGMLNNVIS